MTVIFFSYYYYFFLIGPQALRLDSVWLLLMHLCEIPDGVTQTWKLSELHYLRGLS